MRINNLPVKTWNWLRMNDVEVSVNLDASPLLFTEELPDNVDKATGRGVSALSDKPVRTGMGAEFSNALNNSGIKTTGYIVGDHDEPAKPLYQTFNYNTNDSSNINIFDYTLEEGASLTVIQNLVSEKETAAKTAIIENRYNIGKNASLTIIQTQALGDNFSFYSNIGGRVENGGSFKLIQIVLGGGHNYYGSFTDLTGSASKVNVDLAYSLKGTQTLDMNYVGNHSGRNSESNFNISGVLKDESKKLFRGTIDFHRGCSGSKGAELENVLLIDDTIVNQTIPLILCDEEVVEGAHGATIGRLDENLLFYMKSRGITKKAAYALMERAKLDMVAGKIKDERTREFVSSKIDEMTA